MHVASIHKDINSEEATDQSIFCFFFINQFFAFSPLEAKVCSINVATCMARYITLL